MYPQTHAFSLKSKDGKYYSINNRGELALSDTPNEFKRQPTITNHFSDEPTKLFVFFEDEPVNILAAISREQGILGECFYSCGYDNYNLDFKTWKHILTNETLLINGTKIK